MPVITVTAAPPANAEAERRALSGVAVAVATALRLRPEDVQVTSVHAASAVLGDEVVDAWPVAVLLGRRRPAEQLAAALDAARHSVAQGWARHPDEVWVQWLLAEDLSAAAGSP